MKNKILMLISLTSFPSFINALSYEVRGIERESPNASSAVLCFFLYIINNSRNTYSFNIFASATNARTTATPSYL